MAEVEVNEEEVAKLRAMATADAANTALQIAGDSAGDPRGKRWQRERALQVAQHALYQNGKYVTPESIVRLARIIQPAVDPAHDVHLAVEACRGSFAPSDIDGYGAAILEAVALFSAYADEE